MFVAPSSGEAASSRPSNGLTGYRVAWPALGESILEPFTLDPAPAADVTVRLATSIISTGTERARYLGLLNARVSFPHYPGYAASGVVVGVGPNVESIAVNDRVALLGVAHQSIARLQRLGVYPIPSAVALEDAAILQLGIIASNAVRRAALAHDEPYAVFGAGIIGALAQRIAGTRVSGPCTVVAATDAKAGVALAGGAERFLTVERDLTTIQNLGVPVVIDATGLKVHGAGEWLVEKHGTRTRRSWRKLHRGVDADTGQGVAAVRRLSARLSSELATMLSSCSSSALAPGGSTSRAVICPLSVSKK